MPVNLASPGIVVREVDLTAGRIDPTSDRIGAIVAPFAQGPVNTPTFLRNESELLDLFGKPYSVDKHYEHWLVASSYLAYGGSLRVVRSDDIQLRNATVGGGSTVKVRSIEHYEQLNYDETQMPAIIAAKNPGSWANGIKVGIIDARADQILGISTSSVQTTTFNTAAADRNGTLVATASTVFLSEGTGGIQLGAEIRCDIDGVIAAGTTVTAIPAGGAAGIVTFSTPSSNSAPLTTTFDFGVTETVTTQAALAVGTGVTQAISATLPGIGTWSTLDGYLKGIVTEVGTDEVGVKVLSHVSAGGTETVVDYQAGGVYKFSKSPVGLTTATESEQYATLTQTGSPKDWFDQQKLAVSTSTIGGEVTENTLMWNTVADRPGTTTYAEGRGSRFDEVHVVVVDGEGKVTGNAGTILEKHLGLSKAKDALFSSGAPSFWRSYLKDNSSYIFAGKSPSVVETGYKSGGFTKVTNGDWNTKAQGVIFDSCGASNETLAGGLDYDGKDDLSTGSLKAGVSDLSTGYKLLENGDLYDVDFLLMGSAAHDIEAAQALAQQIISVAEKRKDTLAFISPYRGAALSDSQIDTEDQIRDSETTTSKVLEYYSPITSSTYAVFDSGYKYMYDRFNNTFRYVPLNGDIAGLCARNDINNFPWFSPAGTARGAILNAVKLAYNPSKEQRDRLYSSRVNPVILSSGSGIILFGDKTGFGKQSAFDRINVRRLFIYLENAIESAARDQLFEFNDEITRTTFVNIVEPFLRDVQAKRGIQDYVVVCDETNNTAAVIDNNEFIADIYIKPARSINFIGLTFVATRTGVAFEEVIGNV